MGKKSNLTHQAIRELNKECHFGQSKYEAKQQAKANGRNPALVSGIYSQATYNSYLKVGRQFIADTIRNHSEVKSLQGCRKYVKEFLEKKEEAGASAWTLNQYGSALAKIYHCRKNDFEYDYPARNRADIKRCRGTSSSDYRSHGEKWNKAKMVIKATGCRRMEALRLRKEDFREREDGNLEVYKRGKGGIERWCLVNPKYNHEIREFIKTTETHNINREDRLLLKSELPRSSLHDLRADYARDLYEYFESRGDVANGKIYFCKKDMVGQSYDKGILKEVSYNLQHSRDTVVVSNYLWK